MTILSREEAQEIIDAKFRLGGVYGVVANECPRCLRPWRTNALVGITDDGRVVHMSCIEEALRKEP